MPEQEIVLPPCPCGAKVTGATRFRGRRHPDDPPEIGRVVLEPCMHELTWGTEAYSAWSSEARAAMASMADRARRPSDG